MFTLSVVEGLRPAFGLHISGTRRQNARVIRVEERDGAASFAVRVTVRASRNAIEGEWQGALKVRLAAPPVEGRANEALRRLLAEYLHVPLSAVEIVSGERSRTKRLRIRGLTANRIRELAHRSRP